MDQLSEDKHGNKKQPSEGVDDNQEGNFDPKNRPSGPLAIHDLRRILNKHPFNDPGAADILFKRLVNILNSDSSHATLIGAATPKRNLTPSDPVPDKDRHGKSTEVDGPWETNTQDQLDSSERPETPEISRTVVVKRGGDGFHGEKRYFRLSEGDYDGVEANDTGAAIELRKDVNTIEPPSNNHRLMQLGNKAIDNDIVDHVTSEKIIIRSPQLIKVIKTKVYWPSSAFYDGQKSLSLDSPYRSIGVYRGVLGETLDQIREYLAHNDTEEEGNTLMPSDLHLSKSDLRLTVCHLELFLHEVDKVQDNAIQLEKERHDRKMATFDMLWKLFKPGMVVYTEKDGAKLACRVKILVWNYGSRSRAGPDDPYESVEVDLWHLDHDGM